MRPNKERTKITSLPGLKKELQKFVEEYLHEKFRWATVEDWITEILHERVEDIIMCALGFVWEEDHWHKNCSHWKLENSKEGSVQGVIYDLAKTLTEKHIGPLLEEAQETILKKVLSPKKQERGSPNLRVLLSKRLTQTGTDLGSREREHRGREIVRA